MVGWNMKRTPLFALGVLSTGFWLGACSADSDETSGDGSGGGSPGAGDGGSTGSGGEDGGLPGSGGTGGTATGGSSGRYGDTFGSLSEICDIYAYGQSRKVNECYGWPEPQAPSPRYGCPDVLFSEGSTRVATLEAAWDCVEQWQEVTCEELREGIMPPCVSPGTRAAGELCIADSQCVSGVCTAYLDACGECLTLGDGVTCGDGIVCPGMTYCEDGACVSDFPDPSDPLPGVAQPGEACGNAGCTEGYVCAAADTTDESVCRPVLTVGSTCYADSPGGQPEICGMSDSEIYCDATFTCQLAPQPGSACGRTTTEGPRCADGSGCNASDVCEVFPGPGGPCLESYRCGEGQGCIDDVCKTRVRYGGDCSDPATSFCADNGECQSGVCVPSDEVTLLDELCGIP